MRLILFFAIAVLFASCGTSKKMTLAEQCAEAFPPEIIRDTVKEIHWEVHNFPVEIERFDTLFVDTVPCPPSEDTIYIERVRPFSVPARTFQTTVPLEVRTVTVERIDSALIQAYEDLQIKYRQAITDLEICEARYKESGKSKQSWWLPWAILGALLLLAIVLALKKK